MMKLRTKSQPLSLPADEQTPSTSSAASATFIHGGVRRLSTNSNDQSHSSPDSPLIGRIAKSNARILNGLDLNDEKRSGICVDVFGILPELKVDDLNVDKYPNICKFLASSTNKKSLDVDTLQLIQHELEELISLNVDCQKTIHGEITYMTTGEYPTIDLANRPMPRYELHSKQGPHQELRLSEQNSDFGSFTNFLVDLGLLSSPEEEEAPNILDVPNRFWIWAKEYLRPISKVTVREFKEKLLDRFVGDYFTSRLLAHATTNGTTTAATTTGGATQKRRATFDGHSSSSTDQSPAKKMLKLDKSPSELSPTAAATKGGRLISNGLISAARNGIILETTAVGSSAATEKDEVLAELQRKQHQLKMLYEQTRPVVEQLYVQLRAEHAVQEVFKRLDSADDSLLQLGSKYKKLHIFNSEQRHETEQALGKHSKVYRTFHGQNGNE